MLLILEGPDGAGKSTLAQVLAAELGRTTSDKVEVWSRGAPTHHPLEEYLLPLFSYRPGAGRHLILDRWHWGEYVYPKVLGRSTSLDDAAWWSIEAYLRRLGALVVHCERETRQEYVDVYRERGLDATPDLWQWVQLDQIRLEFTRASYRSQLPTWIYTPDADSAYVDRIVDAARKKEEVYRALDDFTTYLGPIRPAALLLGDVRKPHRLTPAGDGPAFVPFEATSGLYLLRALASLPSRDWRRSVGIANACDVDDVRALWSALGEPPVVALGQKAHGEFSRIVGVPHGVVPHPQYVRRFHHRLHVEYGWLINRASRTREDLSSWPQSFTAAPDATSTPTSSPKSGSSAERDPVATATPLT